MPEHRQNRISRKFELDLDLPNVLWVNGADELEIKLGNVAVDLHGIANSICDGLIAGLIFGFEAPFDVHLVRVRFEVIGAQSIVIGISQSRFTVSNSNNSNVA